MVTKKLKSVVFAWDPNAFSGKGYWYVLGSKGGLGRAASKTERLTLGKPSDKDVLPESAKVYELSEETDDDGKKKSKKSKKEKRKEHEYGKAEDIRKTSIGDLIAKNLVEGKGVGESIKGGVTDKIKAIGTGIKEKFDPMNMAKSIGGNLGAALYGKTFNRSQKDLEYFTGMEKEEPKENKKNEKKSYDVVTKKGKNKNPLNTTIGAGSRPLPLRKNDSVSDVAAKLFSLLRKSYEDKKLQMELDKNFEGERKDEAARRHKEFIDALLGLTGGTVSGSAKAEDQKTGLLDTIKNIADTVSWISKLKDFAGLVGAILASPAFLATVGFLASVALATYIAEKLGADERERLSRLGGEKALAAQKKMNDAPMNEIPGGTFESPNFEASPEFTAAKEEQTVAIKEKQDIVAGLMAKKGYKRYYKTGWFGDRLKDQYTFEDSQGKAPPDALLKQVSDDADLVIKKKDAKYKTSNPEQPKIDTPAAAPENKPLPSGVNLQDNESRPSKPIPAPMPNALGDRMSSAINENNSMQDEIAVAPQPISLNNSKVINTNGTDQTFTFDSAAVRNQDMTLNRIQKAFVRYV